MQSKYKRVLLKLSGEALSGDKKFGLDYDIMDDICRSIKRSADLGVEVGIVVGGGISGVAEQAALWTAQERIILGCLLRQ